MPLRSFASALRSACGLAGDLSAGRDLNHPPISSYWAAAVYRMTESHRQAFSFVFNLRSILFADAAAAWLGLEILLRSSGPRGALATAALRLVPRRHPGEQL